ncbi:MAG TPA: iron-containing alcohol dehydrogenase [Thermoflexales bacterium]|nr:iron-containing alcohol dehydrogenase [Thermoflexales bacterium]HQW35597.1 iron-containing alcohol dehydrogenase [Thermoflexales bacterium]HQZ22194.1 iron-containing alcohol dehydrogenase [Thermoflexales bacterium]
MWFFRSPTIVFGEDALTHLNEISGTRALIITDPSIRKLGLLAPVQGHLGHMQQAVFDEVEPEPSLPTILRAVQHANAFLPDWIIGVGGGSAMDAAKAVWILHENPGLNVEDISPLGPISLRKKAGMIAIPTTSGTGSEATWAFVVTLHDENGVARKLGSGHPQAVPDYAIVDPLMSASMPPKLTADTGLDALTQAIEGYVSTWHNEFSDGLCLVAAQLAFAHLAQAVKHGDDITAREKMALSAAIAGLGYINSMLGIAHSMAHAAGALLGIPHGRACGIFLPHSIEFCAGDGVTRYQDITRFMGWPSADEAEAGAILAAKVRALMREINAPLTIAEAGISRPAFDAALDHLIDNAMSDTVIFSSPRQPSAEELRELFITSFG